MILDVGGERFTAQRNSLLRFPTTRQLISNSIIYHILDSRYGLKIKLDFRFLADASQLKPDAKIVRQFRQSPYLCLSRPVTELQKGF